jgi:hypothetical protein
MPIRFNPEPLPPDHPIFTRGVLFVFQSKLPEGEPAASDDPPLEDEDEDN